MPHCAANFCFNSYKKGYVMLTFPKDSILREKWRIAVRREESWKPTTNHRLCEEHFKLDDWISFRRRIKKDAIPSLFCNCHPSKKQKKINLENENDHSYKSTSTISVCKTLIGQPLTSLNQNHKIDHSYCQTNVKFGHSHDCSIHQVQSSHCCTNNLELQDLSILTSITKNVKTNSPSIASVETDPLAVATFIAQKTDNEIKKMIDKKNKKMQSENKRLRKDNCKRFPFMPTDNRRMESSKTGESTSSNQAPARGERKNTRGSRQKAVDNLSKKFLRNFDPEHSEREKRKLYRRLYQSYRKHLYNDVGIFIRTSDDLCDCLNLDCPGCHFPCSKCASPKCAHDCRNNRKWTYDTIQCEGTDPIIKNPLLKESQTK